MTQSTRFDVLGIGNAIMDIIAPVPDAFLDTHNMDKGGMMLIDQDRALTVNAALSGQGETQMIAGGSAANTLVGIAKMGVRSAYIGKVGADETGEALAQGFQDAGLDFKSNPVTSGTASARCLIAVTPDGERTMNTFLGASVEFSGEDVDHDYVSGADTLYLEGYLFDSDDAKAAFVSASEAAKAAGRKVALTLSDSFCVGRHKASFRHLVDHHVDILFANQDEIFALLDTDSIDNALDQLTQTNTVACITRSAEGSVIQDATRRYHVPAEPVAKVVDTTGAGDQYAAGVLAGRALGLGWQEAGRLGSVAAAEVISHYGARPEADILDLARKAGLSV